MNRVITINTIDHAEELIIKMEKSAKRTKEKIEKLIVDSSANEFLYSMKFLCLWKRPIRRQRFEYNRTTKSTIYIYDISCRSERTNCGISRVISFTLNLGTAGGYDIESSMGILKAEVFSTANPKNNEKLKKDVKRLFESDAEIKIAFIIRRYNILEKKELRSSLVVFV